MPGMSWVMRLPQGLREQPGWVFIGAMCAISGLSYLLGISESTAINERLDAVWLRVWGGFLFVSGLLVTFSTLISNKPLEKLALRLLSLDLLVFMGWIIALVPLSRATIVAALCISLTTMAEIRVAVIKTLLKPLSKSVTEALK